MTEPAQREGPATRPGRDGCSVSGSLLHTATALPWLAPAASSLTHVARLPADAWSSLRLDPGALLLLLRSSTWTSSHLPFADTLLAGPVPVVRALRLLEQSNGCFVDWSEPRVRPVHDACLTLARLSRLLAVRSGKVDPEQAWCAGMLAPLGWLALCAIAPVRVAACLSDPGIERDPIATQVRHLGVEQSLLARRLARHWELPRWLAGVAGHLELPLEHARRFDVEPVLFSMTRLAVYLARLRGVDLGLVGPFDPSEDEAVLGIRLEELGSTDWAGEETPSIRWDDPHHEALLPDLLALAIDNRQLRDVPRLARLEQELDDLHTALRDQVRAEGDRLRAEKMSALAEFAAGAGHEINNPLAVISGQAQYILGHEGDWLSGDHEGGARKALQTIVGQTKRIHGILRELMQFARPGPARANWVDLPTLLGEVVASLEEAASPKRIRLDVIARPERLSILVDAEQIRTALVSLLRNAIEATPPEGWARLVLAWSGTGDRVEVYVEDSGPGPATEQRPHLFDPFYSGRSAGRGRGLGLPLAWRLARQQGGDVYLEPTRPGQPTRFVLVLPRQTPPAGANAA